MGENIPATKRSHLWLYKVASVLGALKFLFNNKAKSLVKFHWQTIQPWALTLFHVS